MKRLSWLFDYRVWLLTLLLQGSSLKNYVASPGIFFRPVLSWGIITIITFAGFAFYFHNQKVQNLTRPLLSSPILTVLMLLATAAISYLGYPRIEGLNIGGTGDDAMIMPVLTMMQGNWLYDVTLFDGAPISPGLGWILLNSPIIIINMYGLINTLYLGVMAYTLRSYSGRWLETNVIFLAMFSAFSFWEQILSRQDLIAIGCSFLILFLLLERLINRKTAVFFGILIGIVSTSRVVFLYVPMLIVLLYLKKDAYIAVLTGGIAFFTAVIIHAAGYFISDFYQPLHLLTQRGPQNVGMGLIILGTIFLILLAVRCFSTIRDNFHDRLFWLSALLLVPLATIAFGELRAMDYRVILWEGARYILPVVPVVTAWSFLTKQPLSSETIQPAHLAEALQYRPKSTMN